MRRTLILLLLAVGMITFAKGADLLVTRSGEYSSGDKKTRLKLSNSADGRLTVEIAFKIHIQVPAIGTNTEVTDSRQLADWPANQRRWACCISKAGDVWLYDGEGMFTLFQRKPDRIETLASCSEPHLGDRAPKIMKHWIARQPAEPDAPVNRSRPVTPQTNRTRSARTAWARTLVI